MKKLIAKWFGLYTQADMVSFGTYLLSDKRFRLIEDNTETTAQFDLRFKQVHDGDLDQWRNL